MILRIVVATPRRFFKGDMSRVPSEGQWPFQETKLVLSSYHIYKTYVRPMQGLCKGTIPLILCWVVHFRKLSYSLHEAFLSTGRFWWLPGSQFMFWAERNANYMLYVYKMHMLYVYKMLFRDSFYRGLAWPSIKCPSRATYFIILYRASLPASKMIGARCCRWMMHFIGGILCKMLRYLWTMLWKESAFYRGKLGATLIFRMLSEHILVCMERAFYRGFTFLVFRRWQFEGCTWMRTDSCNCRVWVEHTRAPCNLYYIPLGQPSKNLSQANLEVSGVRTKKFQRDPAISGKRLYKMLSPTKGDPRMDG